MFCSLERTSTIFPPPRSISQASSVAAASTSSATSSARSSAARRKTCGVCTDHSALRCSVSATSAVPARARLTVSVTGMAAIAPSALASLASASSTRRASSAVTSGLAASCTSTGPGCEEAPSARRTDSERTAPPVTDFRPPGGATPAGSASTISSISPTADSASIDHCSSGRPRSVTSAFGIRAPRRSPLPAARIRARLIASRRLRARASRPSPILGRARRPFQSAAAPASWLEAESASSSSR